jgi:hypothetical protein
MGSLGFSTPFDRFVHLSQVSRGSGICLFTFALFTLLALNTLTNFLASYPVQSGLRAITKEGMGLPPHPAFEQSHHEISNVGTRAKGNQAREGAAQRT